RRSERDPLRSGRAHEGAHRRGAGGLRRTPRRDLIAESAPQRTLCRERSRRGRARGAAAPLPMNDPGSIVIVGAGPTGLGAADRLQQLGAHDFLVVERGEVAGAPLPDNFRQWILWTFGEALAEMFLLPYNFKVWAYPPEMLSRSWVGDRVSVPDLERIRRNVHERRDDVSWGPNNTFRFPKRG